MAAENSADFQIFPGHANNVEKGLALQLELLGGLEAPLLKNIQSMLQNEMKHICLKLPFQRLERLLFDAKHSKSLRKMREQKRVGNDCEVEKRTQA